MICKLYPAGFANIDDVNNRSIFFLLACLPCLAEVIIIRAIAHLVHLFNLAVGAGARPRPFAAWQEAAAADPDIKANKI